MKISRMIVGHCVCFRVIMFLCVMWMMPWLKIWQRGGLCLCAQTVKVVHMRSYLMAVQEQDIIISTGDGMVWATVISGCRHLIRQYREQGVAMAHIIMDKCSLQVFKRLSPKGRCMVAMIMNLWLEGILFM